MVLEMCLRIIVLRHGSRGGGGGRGVNFGRRDEVSPALLGSHGKYFSLSRVRLKSIHPNGAKSF